MKSDCGFVVETNTLSSNSSASVNDGVMNQPDWAHAIPGAPTARTANPSIASMRFMRRVPETRIYHTLNSASAPLCRSGSRAAALLRRLQPLPAHVDAPREGEAALHEPPERG